MCLFCNSMMRCVGGVDPHREKAKNYIAKLNPKCYTSYLCHFLQQPINFLTICILGQFHFYFITLLENKISYKQKILFYINVSSYTL